MIHKASHTYMKELYKDDYFGEVEFFTDESRKLTARTTDFSECYVISKKNFLFIA
jgi:CRP-like cAMP-binding protein